MASNKNTNGDRPHLTALRCPSCWNKRNQLARHVHFLQLGDDNAITFHLRDEYGELAERDGTLTGVIAWVSSVRASLHDRVDCFGRPLPVWEAWLMAHGVSTTEIDAFRTVRAA